MLNFDVTAFHNWCWHILVYTYVYMYIQLCTCIYGEICTQQTSYPPQNRMRQVWLNNKYMKRDRKQTRNGFLKVSIYLKTKEQIKFQISWKLEKIWISNFPIYLNVREKTWISNWDRHHQNVIIYVLKCEPQAKYNSQKFWTKPW